MARADQFSAHSQLGPSQVVNCAFFADMADRLQALVSYGDAYPNLDTSKVLDEHMGGIFGCGPFAMVQQIFPPAALLGLSSNLKRATEARVFESKKPHYKYMQANWPMSDDARAKVLACVAEQMDTHTVEIENCLCEMTRGRSNVRDFFYQGQTFYDIRFVQESGEYCLYEKEWGDDGIWKKAEAKKDGAEDGGSN